MCPSTFGRKGIKSAVMIQPTTETEKLLAYAAAVACPTGSIRTRIPDPLMKKALTVFPAPIDPVNLPGVMHMGYHSVPSYGATSYLITRSVTDAQGQVRPANILIDVPRFNSRLAKVVEEEFGGIDKIIITHRDNVHDLDKWKTRFPQATRVIHRADVDASTTTCEIKLESGGSWQVANILAYFLFLLLLFPLLLSCMSPFCGHMIDGLGCAHRTHPWTHRRLSLYDDRHGL